MEEDEKKVESTEPVESPVVEGGQNTETPNYNDYSGNANGGDGSAVKPDKNKIVLIVAIVIAVVAVCLIFNMFLNPKAGAKRAVKQYISAFNSANVKKMLKLTDPYASYVLGTLDEDEYDDFWDEYKDFIKDEDDTYDRLKDAYEDSLDSDEIDEAKESLEDLMEDKSIKVKEIKSVKKESKNLYKVKAKLTLKDDDDKDSATANFYVMKKGMSYYIVSGFNGISMF